MTNINKTQTDMLVIVQISIDSLKATRNYFTVYASTTNYKYYEHYIKLLKLSSWLNFINL